MSTTKLFWCVYVPNAGLSRHNSLQAAEEHAEKVVRSENKEVLILKPYCTIKPVTTFEHNFFEETTP